MAKPRTYECPICFATLKLKHPPKPGAKLRCPSCESVFLPEGDAMADDSTPPASTGSGTRRPSQTEYDSQTAEFPLTSWQMTVLSGGLTFLLIAGVVLFLFWEQIFPEGFGPEVDLAYCQLPDQTTTIELRPAELLNASALPPAVRQNPTMTETSQALRQLLGVELHEVEAVEFQMQGANLGLPGVEAAAVPTPFPGLIVLKALKPLERPKTSPQRIEGIRCYAIHQEWSGPVVQLLPLLPLDTMFFANPNTAILGSQATIREILQQWKAQAPRQKQRPDTQGATVCVLLHEKPVRELLALISRLATANPLLAQGQARAEWQQITQSLADHSSNLSVSASLGSQVSWSATLYGKDSAATQPMHDAFENLRQKGMEQLTSLSMLAALMPPEAQAQLNLAKQILSTPWQMANDRIQVTFALPAEYEAQALQALVKLFLPLGTLRLGSSSAQTTTSANEAGSSSVVAQ